MVDVKSDQNPGSNGDGKKRRPWKMKALLGSVLFFAGIAFFLGFTSVLEGTNTTEFCTSCHSMQWVDAEYKQSVHYRNVSGVGAGCADCHVPKPLGPKLLAKVMAARDVYGEITGVIDTKQKYEAHKWEMANRVWARMEASDSRECRTCHDLNAMDLDEQGRSARKRHQRAEENGETCIECHKGVAHIEPEEPEEPEELKAAASPPGHSG